MNIEQERHAFEAWHQQYYGEHCVYVLDEYGEYADKRVQSAFNVWQARAALAARLNACESRARAGLDVEAVLRLFLTGGGFIAECDIPHIVAALAAQKADAPAAPHLQSANCEQDASQSRFTWPPGHTLKDLTREMTADDIAKDARLRAALTKENSND